jgi:amidase
VTRTDGIDRILAADRLDAIVAPAYGDSSPAAVAGYPSISVPTGVTDDGRPGGVWIYGGFLAEPTLLGLAADLERAVSPRPRPVFAGRLPGAPPDFGLCATPIGSRRRATRTDLPRDG